MKTTYRAMQISRPGLLELVERPTPTPASGEVLIEVEACGICGADIGDIEGSDPTLQPPRAPGHDIDTNTNTNTNTNEEDAVARLKSMGGAQAIVTTIGQPSTVSALVGALVP